MSLSPYLPDVIVIYGAKPALFAACGRPGPITMQSFGPFRLQGGPHLRVALPARSIDWEMP
ncbi:MAG: hypothetical protein M9915_07880 [Rhizobacter sp.]|jgi:hypothetical protein|nr:hypothetical protein [Burkholderiaceae bacterium]MCO5123646.1 hypothetical protein [Rhizobacter sp.]